MLSQGYTTGGTTGDDRFSDNDLSKALAQQRMCLERRASSWMNAESSDSENHKDTNTETLRVVTDVVRKIKSQLDQLTAGEDPLEMKSPKQSDARLNESLKRLEVTLRHNLEELQSLNQKLRMLKRCTFGGFSVMTGGLLLWAWLLHLNKSQMHACEANDGLEDFYL
uniref:Uncharacterized protein n=2 Tax=Lotharella oceanica TaxID=641309 RepID=A0A7S2TX27_9EUKA|mmetsp:Transcript_30918/g.57724  ORF Transcript_30918/g.57724 Transcript_30918/m.57724 type:complete len:167 (+) Transcript_30918:328-828(+)|eukprot:CAMPEP_0170169490 /NCGR_PEP_ID=MMETSP0040_2-20121228/2411_1 /TAXON_ID=641309 /ORGANISM="Lotharella oceanica, Strain CCMP622" /LENGTH=166 /DNA_ID=CAMNT_0010408271 /DNA_START=258 /DNA_END=758 /DNA_ORIENTATION=+